MLDFDRKTHKAESFDHRNIKTIIGLCHENPECQIIWEVVNCIKSRVDNSASWLTYKVRALKPCALHGDPVCFMLCEVRVPQIEQLQWTLRFAGCLLTHRSAGRPLTLRMADTLSMFGHSSHSTFRAMKPWYIDICFRGCRFFAFHLRQNKCDHKAPMDTHTTSIL